MNNKEFAKGAERLIDPITVGTVHVLQQFSGSLPLPLQHYLMKRAAKTTPQMGFVVEPYAFFLFYEVEDTQKTKELLPEGFSLVKTCICEDDEPAYYAIVCFFRVHTSAFWGARGEYYLVAEDEQTGLVSWIIVDYLSDTISHDRRYGLRGPSAPGSVVTITCEGRVLVDMECSRGGGRMAFSSGLESSCMRKLGKRLWIEGNLSVGYGALVNDSKAGTFSLTFLPDVMEQALDIPLENLEVECATWHGEILSSRPVRMICFPYAQHLLSDSPESASGYASEEELVRAARSIDFSKIPTMEIGSFRTQFIAGTIVTWSVIAALIAALVLA